MRTSWLLGTALLAVAAAAGTADAGETKTVNVNCGTGETIGGALDAHAKPGRALTINIKGTCTEHVVVTAPDTTLKGDPSATVIGTDPGQNTILVNGAERVTIENLTVSGARNGIAAVNAASVTVENVQAQDNAQSGVVSFTGSRVNVNASGLHDNGLNGLAVTDNAAGFLTNSTVADNGSSGVVVQRGSSARIGQNGFGVNGPNTIQNNGSHGVFVYQAAQALVHGNTITGNGSAGVFVESGAATVTGNTVQSNGTYGVGAISSGVRIGLTDQNTAGGNTISGSGLDGIGVFNTSHVYVYSNSVAGNGRDGINVGRASLRLLGSNTISGNAVRGISVNQGVLFQAVGDFNLPVTVDTISGNANDGIGVFQGATADLRKAAITGNGARGFTLTNNASLRLVDTTISGNAGDGIGLFSGSALLTAAPAVTISNNGANGVNLFQAAMAELGFATVTNNGQRGIVASGGSKLRLLGTTVSLHANSEGIGVFDGSTALLQCTLAPFPNCAAGTVTQITQNRFNGVNVATGSMALLQGVTISGTVSGFGVRVDTNSTLRLQTASTQITGNQSGGISISHASVVNFNPPAAVVSGNDGLGSFQVTCFGAPSVIVSNGGGGTTGVGPGGISPACTVYP